MKFIEDMVVGEIKVLGKHRFATREIEDFASEFDPACLGSEHGPSRASGWLIGARYLRLLVDAYHAEIDAQKARGERAALWGPSPGFRELAWPTPVLADDDVTYVNELRSVRKSKSRPGWGICEFLNTGRNQRGDLVFSMTAIIMSEARS
jgi:acyl dehydratase